MFSTVTYPEENKKQKKNSSHGCQLLFYSILWHIHMTVFSKGFAIMCVRREACKIKGFWRKAADWILQGTADKPVPSPNAAGASAYDFHFFPSKWGSITGKKGETAVGSMYTWAWGTGVAQESSPVTWQAQIYTWGVQEQVVNAPMFITWWQYCTTHSTACIERQECRKDPFLSKSYKFWDIYLVHTHILIYFCMCASYLEINTCKIKSVVYLLLLYWVKIIKNTSVITINYNENILICLQGWQHRKPETNCNKSTCIHARRQPIKQAVC